MTQQEPDERIATVTYLFGIAPESAPAAQEPAGRVPAVESAGRVPAEPVYRDQQPLPTPAQAENISMHALTRRGMSVGEMTRLLETRQIEPDQVHAEIERLEGVGLLDDEALAENLVRSLQERKGLGRSAISAELRRRRVDPSAIDGALESIDSDDELRRATEVAVKRASQLRSYDPETAKRRLGAYLQRRGYSGSVLSAAMGAAFAPQSGGGGVQFR